MTTTLRIGRHAALCRGRRDRACSARLRRRRRPGRSDGAKLSVATTVAPITSIVANIGGDRVKITGIVPEGTNSHTFEPKPSVAELLSQVDVLYVNGLKLEEPTSKLAEQTLKGGADIVELGTRAIPASEYAYDFSFPKSGGKPNPHLWTDPLYAVATRRSCATTSPDATPPTARTSSRTSTASRPRSTTSTRRCARRSRRSRAPSASC